MFYREKASGSVNMNRDGVFMFVRLVKGDFKKLRAQIKGEKKW